MKFLIDWIKWSWIEGILILLLLLVSCRSVTVTPISVTVMPTKSVRASPERLVVLTSVAPSQTQIPTLKPELDSRKVVSGWVVAGGEVSSKGPTDAPRKFRYEVKTEDGVSVNVTYTAYPPSPAASKSKITLKFHQGEILIGDYLVAQGTYTQTTHTLVVAEEGDFIETFPQKP